MNPVHAKRILIAILLLAALLRIGWIARGDAQNDEVLYGFRAIGLMDFDEADVQRTPLEWWDPSPPWWIHLSFHDHPPLVFLIQHASISLFGENNVGLRLPSALLGIASVYLLFLLGALLYSPRVGLFAACMLAVTVNHVYISRVGLQESYVIFFLLLASYLFLRAAREGRSFIPVGIAAGCAFLTKYTTFIMLPLFTVYLFLFHRSAFRRKDLWLAFAVAAFLFLPVLIYNISLYRTVGHFDFQFSSLFHQEPAAWQSMPGKDIGTLGDRASDFLPRLVASNSWLFLVLSLLSLVFLRNRFVITALLSLIALFSLIGPASRFLTMLTPFLALSAAPLFERKKFAMLLIPIAVFELFYSINNQLVYYPIGRNPWLSSDIRLENANAGQNELRAFFEHEFARKIPAATFSMKYRFVEREQDASLKQGRRKGYAPYGAMIVTEGEFMRTGKLWALDRLQIYHGWPILPLATYRDYLIEHGSTYYTNAGFTDYYFVTPAGTVPALEFEGLEPMTIENPRGEAAFMVYHRHGGVP